MKIKNDLLEGDNIKFVKTPNHSGVFKAGDLDTIVIHYTAGPTAASAINTLTSPRVKASAHLVIERDGNVTQLAPFNVITWHAGPSTHNGRDGLNKYSIGIEIVNEGPLEQSGDIYRSWSGKRYTKEDVIYAVDRNDVKSKYWHVYTPEQIEVVTDICQLLVDTYGLKFILGHEEIAPGRKFDPGPAFPLDRMRDRILAGRRDEDSGVTLPDKGRVMVDKLNIRAQPENGEVVAKPLQKGTIVRLVEEKNGWYKIAVEIEGWVFGKYIGNI